MAKKQSRRDRFRRLADGRCPIHGLHLKPIWIDKEEAMQGREGEVIATDTVEGLNSRIKKPEGKMLKRGASHYGEYAGHHAIQLECPRRNCDIHAVAMFDKHPHVPLVAIAEAVEGRKPKPKSARKQENITKNSDESYDKSQNIPQNPNNIPQNHQKSQKGKKDNRQERKNRTAKLLFELTYDHKYLIDDAFDYWLGRPEFSFKDVEIEIGDGVNKIEWDKLQRIDNLWFFEARAHFHLLQFMAGLEWLEYGKQGHIFENSKHKDTDYMSMFFSINIEMMIGMAHLAGIIDGAVMDKLEDYYTRPLFAGDTNDRVKEANRPEDDPAINDLLDYNENADELQDELQDIHDEYMTEYDAEYVEFMDYSVDAEGKDDRAGHEDDRSIGDEDGIDASEPDPTIPITPTSLNTSKDKAIVPLPFTVSQSVMRRSEDYARQLKDTFNMTDEKIMEYLWVTNVEFVIVQGCIEMLREMVSGYIRTLYPSLVWGDYIEAMYQLDDEVVDADNVRNRNYPYKKKGKGSNSKPQRRRRKRPNSKKDEGQKGQDKGKNNPPLLPPSAPIQ